jgi:hypothetical protein
MESAKARPARRVTAARAKMATVIEPKRRTGVFMRNTPLLEFAAWLFLILNVREFKQEEVGVNIFSEQAME